MRYLEDPRVLYDYNVESFDGLFEMPSHTSMLKLAETLFVRLFPTQIDDNSNQCSQNDNHNSLISTPPKASLRELMNRKKQRLETPLQNNCSFL